MLKADFESLATHFRFGFSYAFLVGDNLTKPKIGQSIFCGHDFVRILVSSQRFQQVALG